MRALSHSLARPRPGLSWPRFPAELCSLSDFTLFCLRPRYFIFARINALNSVFHLFHPWVCLQLKIHTKSAAHISRPPTRPVARASLPFVAERVTVLFERLAFQLGHSSGTENGRYCKYSSTATLSTTFKAIKLKKEFCRKMENIKESKMNSLLAYVKSLKVISLDCYSWKIGCKIF